MRDGKSGAIWRLKSELHVPQLLLGCRGNDPQAVADLGVYLSTVREEWGPPGQQLQETAGEADANGAPVAEGQACIQTHQLTLRKNNTSQYITLQPDHGI